LDQLLEEIMALLLDLDGTIVRFPIDWSRFYKFLREMGIELKFLEFIRRFWGTEVFWRSHEYLSSLELEALQRVEVYEKVSDLLERISRRTPVAIVTFQSRRAAEEALRVAGIDHVVKTIVSRDDCGSRLTQLRLALSRLGASPEGSFFVGDKVNDAIAALLCGVRCVLVFRGLRESRISESDDILEDLNSWGVPTFSSLRDALRFVERSLP